MIAYTLSRATRAVLTLLGVAIVAFFLVRLSGNPAALMLGPEATPEDIARLSESLGLNDPVWQQLGSFLGGLVALDLGDSYTQNIPAMEVVLSRFPATLQLALTSFVVAVVVALVLVLLIVRFDLKWLREAMTWLGSARQAIPSFWFALMLVIVFSVNLGWFPALGNRDGIASLVLPVVTVATLELALYLRLFDQGFFDEMGQDYVRTARAKGAGDSRVLVSHVLPNALLPVVTIAGLNLGALLGGLLVVEIVFGWPGLGQLLLTAVNSRDYPVVQACLIVIAFFFVFVNLVVDLLYGVLDPRTRVRATR
jgi:peptide/nickel transport system permease protein